MKTKGLVGPPPDPPPPIPPDLNAILGIDEQHAAVFRKTLAKHQSLHLLIARDGHFRREHLTGRELDGDQGIVLCGDSRS